MSGSQSRACLREGPRIFLRRGYPFCGNTRTHSPANLLQKGRTCCQELDRLRSAVGKYLSSHLDLGA